MLRRYVSVLWISYNGEGSTATGAAARGWRSGLVPDILPVNDGAWRSPVAHLLWEQGVAGSNPAAPIEDGRSGGATSG